MPLACLIHFAESIAAKSLKENDPLKKNRDGVFY